MRRNEDAFSRLQELSDLGLSKRGAAKILYNEGFHNSLEAARGFVRSHTNAKGLSGRDNIKWNTNLPMPDETGFGIKDISDSDGVLMLCDIHLPFHDTDTIEKALKDKDEYDTIIIQEVFDFYALSRFDKTRLISVAREQEMFFQFMEWMREIVPNHKIYFQIGNHDERFMLTLMRKAQEFSELAGMEFETIFNFSEYNIELVPMRNLMLYRGLYIGHGHEIGARGAPVSPARTFMLKTKGNFIGGHFHRTSEQLTRDIKDDVTGCWSVGCACDLHPLYAPINDWNNGYAIIRPFGKDQFRVKNIKLF